MSVYKINIRYTNQPHAMAAALKKKKIKRGDKVKLISDEGFTQFEAMAALILFFIGIASLLDKKRKQDAASKLLEDLYKEYKTPGELEAQIKKEYNVTVEIEQEADEEREFWQEAGARSMAKAYDKDEPDYSDVKIRESNPQYKPWKRVK
jgi:hypothetical protein